MIQKKSYKEMIRNRISRMEAVDLALRWCKAKERWITHVYDTFINIYTEKSDRYDATRTILGISSKYNQFDFHKTIDWDNLEEYDQLYWSAVESWVLWFQKVGLVIEDDIKHGATVEDLLKYTKDTADPTKLAQYLIDNLS